MAGQAQFGGKPVKRWVCRLLLFLVVMAAVGISLFLLRTRDRYPEYSLDINIRASLPSPLRAGFAALPITPEIPEPWEDRNGNARFDSQDSFSDLNGNGEFDGVWIAGFGKGRAAAGVHDELWARTMVIDDSRTRVAIVSLDAIGLFHDDVIEIRRDISPAAAVDYVIVTSTHDHEAPDLLGLWGPSYWSSGVNREYLSMVKQRAGRSVEQAVENLQNVRLRITEDPGGAAQLLTDTRKPLVMDPTLRLVQAVSAETGQNLGMLVAWANHPETTWSENLLITSDFPHYLREGIEKGVRVNGETIEEGIGGVVVYVNGAIGGLLTTHDQFEVRDPVTGAAFVEPSFDKARAQGHTLALLALRALRSPGVSETQQASLGLRARTVQIPLDNPIFRLAAFLKVIDRGLTSWMSLRTEVAALSLADLSIICTPGEIYPEIIEGGIEAPPGRDFDIEPQELPPIRDEMPGRFKIVLGLANDEIGYIIPQSEWDEDPPYLYGAEESPYGEINSAGPRTGPLIHREILSVLESLKESRSVALGSRPLVDSSQGKIHE